MENPFNSLNVSIIKNEEKSDLETLLEFSSKYSKFFCLDCERTPEIQFKYLENLTRFTIKFSNTSKIYNKYQ